MLSANRGLNTSNDICSTSPGSLQLRSRFGRPGGHTSCAIVGNSGLLLRSRLGKEIDEHDLVIRCNLSPIGGWEEVVGSKTSLRVMSTFSLQTTIKHHRRRLAEQRNATICPRYMLYANSLWGRRTAAGLKSAFSCPLKERLVGASALPRPSRVEARFAALPGNLVSGLKAVAIAMELCPAGATLFGFTHKEMLRRHFNALLTTRYHYYDAVLPDTKIDPSVRKIAAALSRLALQQPRCIRLHTPRTLLPPYTPPANPRVLDTLVDGITASAASVM